jgi:hypothetical protein
MSTTLSAVVVPGPRRRECRYEQMNYIPGESKSDYLKRLSIFPTESLSDGGRALLNAKITALTKIVNSKARAVCLPRM